MIGCLLNPHWKQSKKLWHTCAAAHSETPSWRLKLAKAHVYNLQALERRILRRSIADFWVWRNLWWQMSWHTRDLDSKMILTIVGVPYDVDSYRDIQVWDSDGRWHSAIEQLRAQYVEAVPLLEFTHPTQLMERGAHSSIIDEVSWKTKCY